VTVVSFADSKILDEQVIQEIGDELFALIDEHYKVKLLLNFENVDYLSSAALGKLIILNRKVREENGDLKFCSIKPKIYDVFKITKLDKIFSIYEDEERALAKFKS
jgi:anti-sigma B factor antagonist